MKADETPSAGPDLQRRDVRKKAVAGTVGLVGLNAFGSEARADEGTQLPEIQPPDAPRSGPRPAVRSSVKITKLETFLVKPRWLFLKVHTDAGVVGLGEPITEGRALTCAAASRRSNPTW